jgi:hypothetical protein
VTVIRTYIGVIVLGLVATMPSVLSAQTAPLSAVGTLTCTTSDAPRRTRADVNLSCEFQGLAGGEGNFTGHITRKGPAKLPSGKRVLMWAVLASRLDVEARMLEGSYRGLTGGQHAGRLVGGSNGSIVLRPVTITSQVGDKPVASVLELRLKPVKA